MATAVGDYPERKRGAEVIQPGPPSPSPVPQRGPTRSGNDRPLGCILMALGLPMALGGTLVSFTIIGAIIGIPMALIGGVLFGYGFTKLVQ